MAIAYKSAGAGAGTETSGAALNLVCPAVVAANDILIAHVVHLNNTTAPSEPAGWTTLFGPSGLGTGTPTGRAWCFGKIAAGTEDGSTVSFGTAGGTSGRLGRIYSFDGYVSGTIGDVVPAASFTQNSSETDPVIQAVTTTVAGAKAVALVSQDDNNSHGDLGAVTGGTWAEAVADYVDANWGAQGAKLQLQVGTPSSDPGTISGGTVAGTDDEANTICFEIRPNAPAATENFDATGALAAQAAAVAGSATRGRVSSGALAAQAAAVSGAGVVGRTSSGALAAQAATIAGTAVVGRAASGTLSAQAASIEGDATVTSLPDNFDSTGVLAAQPASIAGTVSINRAASGALAAQAAAISGAGETTAVPPLFRNRIAGGFIRI